MWFKLPPGNTSPPSAAIFLYDEENLVFQVVMPLINLALITHLTMCDAAGLINFMVITRLFMVLWCEDSCLALWILRKDHAYHMNHHMFMVYKDCFRCCTCSFSFLDLKVALWSKQLCVQCQVFAHSCARNHPRHQSAILNWWPRTGCSILAPLSACLLCFNCGQSYLQLLNLAFSSASWAAFLQNMKVPSLRQICDFTHYSLFFISFKIRHRKWIFSCFQKLWYFF